MVVIHLSSFRLKSIESNFIGKFGLKSFHSQQGLPL
jgi:hypothetical protein